MTLRENIPFIIIALCGVFISSIAQVMLKKEAVRAHKGLLGEYLNPLVIGGYALMLLSTFMLVASFRGIPLSMGPVLEATSYLYVSAFGRAIFKERLTRAKVVALMIIVAGILLYAAGLH